MLLGDPSPAAEFLRRSPDLHCILSEQWTFIWTAGPWRELLGFSPGELAEISFPELVVAADVGPLLEALARADGSPVERTARMRHRDGGVRWFSWNGRAEGAVGRVHATGRETSERIDLEQARARDIERMEYAALHDPLTGLANRKLLEEYLRLSIAAMKRDGPPPLVLFADLDDFKRINDELGHELGDRALAIVAERLRSAVRPSDLIARVGGDEFVLVLSGGDLDSARRRILEAVAAPVTLGGRDYELGVSVGGALAASEESSPAEVIYAADADMYRQKRSSRTPRQPVPPDQGADGSGS